MILMRCGLRVTDALRLRADCLVTDADGAPYLRYVNHKMKRDALVPIDEQLRDLIAEHRQHTAERWPAGTPVLFPRPTKNIDGTAPDRQPDLPDGALRWLDVCDIRDEHDRPVQLTPHQWRHTLGTRLINRDVPQEVVRRILDHDSPQMTAHYARLHDTTVRRHWEAARKVNINGETVTLDPDGPLAEAAWAKQRLGRATQALPNGYCGLPVQKSCPHANACLTCPMFLTTPEFLPQHREHRQQVLQIITAAEARGQQRLAEMNQQVLANLDSIITALDATPQPTAGRPPMRADNTTHLVTAARRRHELTRAKAIRGAARTRPGRQPCSPSNPSPSTPASPAPGSTPSPTSTPRSNACAHTHRGPTAPIPAPQRATDDSLRRRLRNRRTAATANSPTKTSGYAGNSPTRSVNSATTDEPDPPHRRSSRTSQLGNDRPVLTDKPACHAAAS